MRRTAIVLAAIAVGLLAALPSAEARRWHRPLPSQQRKSAAKPRPAEPAADTVAPDSGKVAVNGFEKALRSSTESMFVTNSTGRDISSLYLDITYLDMKGRMLHRNAQWIEADIPAGETRMVYVRSFDRQNLFYYHLSPQPKRASRATPFKVSVEVPLIIHPATPQP